MPVVADAEHWTFRGGPDATAFGKPYVRAAQGQVQHDRKFYLYNILPDLPLADYRDTIRLCRHYAHEFGWTEIIFERIKDGIAHVVHIPIKPSKRLKDKPNGEYRRPETCALPGTVESGAGV